jgi:hypothetical protein
MPRPTQTIAQKAAIFIILAAAAISSQAQTQPAQPAEDMGSMQHHSHPMIPAGPLKITVGAQSATFTPQQLAALPHTTITVFNGHAQVNQTYSGVPLINLLTPLGVTDKPRDKALRQYIEAIGSDDYMVVYSIGEIAPDIHDGTVIVADTLDGKPITESGPFQLVATGEKHPARWVRNLVAIRVLQAE